MIARIEFVTILFLDDSPALSPVTNYRVLAPLHALMGRPTLAQSPGHWASSSSCVGLLILT
jgi:hypothetical protein